MSAQTKGSLNHTILLDQMTRLVANSAEVDFTGLTSVVELSVAF